MKKRKSTIALILAICLIISGIPQTAFGVSKDKEKSDSSELMIDSTGMQIMGEGGSSLILKQNGTVWAWEIMNLGNLDMVQ